MTADDEQRRRADRQDVAEVLVRYATGIDRRDWDLFRTCFTADVHADYQDIAVWVGVEEITAFMDAAHAGMGRTLHRITNIDVRLDGDRATARSYVDAVLMAADGGSGFNPVGFYDDELVRTADGWRIARRRFTMVRATALAD